MQGKFNVEDMDSFCKINKIVENLSMNNVNITTIIKYEIFILFFLFSKTDYNVREIINHRKKDKDWTFLEYDIKIRFFPFTEFFSYSLNTRVHENLKKKYES